MKINIFFTLLYCAFFLSISTNAQVTIGCNEEPVGGSLLDLKESSAIGENSTKGLILPRVQLVSQSSLAPCVPGTPDEDEKANHIGLCLYNVTDDITENLCPGPYVWVMSLNWQRMEGECPESPNITISPSTWDAPKEGGTQTFTITSNVPWTINVTDTNSAISSISPTSGNAGTTTITVIISPTGMYNQKIVTLDAVSTDSANPASAQAVITQEGICEYYTAGNYEIYCVDLTGGFAYGKSVCSSIVPETNPTNKFELMPFGIHSAIFGDRSKFPEATYWIGDQPQPNGGQAIITLEYTETNTTINFTGTTALNSNYLIRCVRYVGP